MRYAIVNSVNKILNVIEWDGITPYTPPDGCGLICDDNISLDMVYDITDGLFKKPVKEEENV